MIQCKEKCGLPFTMTLEVYLKHMLEHCNSVNVDADMVLGSLYDCLSTAVIMYY